MAFDLKAKLSRMEQIKEEKPAYRNLLDFYAKISIAKEEFTQSLKPLPFSVDEQLVQLKFKAGFPILDKNAIALDSEALEKYCLRLLTISHERNSDAAGKLVAYIEAGNLDIRKSLQEMWEGKLMTGEWKKEEMGDPTLLYFLLSESLKPLYEYGAGKLRDLIDANLWGKGYCPVCGETPPIAAIQEEKWSRVLFCVYCGMEWDFPFLMCPFCGNEEEGIKYLHVGNEKQYRIEVCKTCQKYLKVVDLETLGHPVPLDIENIVTLHLDILAQREGYLRGAPYHLLI